ncbi:MAG: hypothetical protein RL545_838, partial [Actinomycetota bacterium]
MEQVRTCVGCRQRETRKSLIRLVLVNSKVSVDEGKKLPGRGAWLHAKTECLQLALNRKALGRAFKQRFEAGSGAKLAEVAGRRAVVRLDRVVQIDDAADELRLEGADAAVVEQVQPRGAAGLLEDGIVAEVGIAMDDAVVREREPPGAEHGARPGDDPLPREAAAPTAPICHPGRPACCACWPKCSTGSP